MSERQFQAGDVVFQPGDPSGEAYLILSGSVEIFAHAGDRLVRIAQCGPGDVFGEMSLLEDRPRSLTARVATPCRATTLNRSEFEHFVLHNPERCLRYLQCLFGRLRATSERAAFADDTQLQHPLVVAITIRPLTVRASRSMSEKVLSVRKYPFRIGRLADPSESRPAETNHLAIHDTRPFNVSRNHAAIELTPDGSPIIVDLGSSLGTIVNDQRIGTGSSTRQAKLLPGENLLILGSRESPFQYRLTVGGAAEAHSPGEQRS